MFFGFFFWLSDLQLEDRLCERVWEKETGMRPHPLMSEFYKQRIVLNVRKTDADNDDHEGFVCMKNVFLILPS